MTHTNLTVVKIHQGSLLRNVLAMSPENGQIWSGGIADSLTSQEARRTLTARRWSLLGWSTGNWRMSPESSKAGQVKVISRIFCLQEVAEKVWSSSKRWHCGCCTQRTARWLCCLAAYVRARKLAEGWSDGHNYSHNSRSCNIFGRDNEINELTIHRRDYWKRRKRHAK